MTTSGSFGSGWTGSVATARSSGIVDWASEVSGGVEVSGVSPSVPPGKNDDAPRAERGRGFAPARLGPEELLTRRPPLEDEVDPARSRPGDGEGKFAASNCGERTCEPGREGAGDGGAGRSARSCEFERGFVGTGWARIVSAAEAVMGVPSGPIRGAASVDEDCAAGTA